MSDHLNQIALRYATDGKGKVYFRACPRCGQLSWSCTEASETLEVKISGDLSIDQCGPCSFVAQRYPELFAWIGNVIATAQVPSHAVLSPHDGEKP